MNDRTQLSIHPRNWPTGDRKLVNTCANSSLGKRLTRQLVGLERHAEQHPTDAMTGARIATVKNALKS